MQLPQSVQSYFLALKFPREQRWVIGMTRVFTCTAVLGFTIQGLAGLFILNHSNLAIAGTIGIFLMLVALRINDSGRTRLARIVRLISALSCTTYLISQTGGLSSPIFYWAGVLVLGAVFSFGAKAGIPTSLALTGIATYFYAQSQDTFLLVQFVCALAFTYTLSLLFDRLSKHYIRNSELRAETIKTILDNVKFGFVLVGPDLKVQDGYSKSCLHLLGSNLHPGTDFLQILGLDRHRYALLYKDFMEQAFHDELPFDMTLGQLPRFVDFGDRVLDISGAVVRDRNHKVVKILVTVIDATDAQRAERESQRVKQLLRFVKDHDALIDYINDFKISIKACLEFIATQDMRFLRAEMHTLKGNAKVFGIDGLAQLIHDRESKNSVSHEDVIAIEEEMKRFLRDNFDVLHVDYNSTSEETWLLTEAQLQRLNQLAQPTQLEQNTQALAEILGQIQMKPAEVLLGLLPDHSVRLAESLGKELQVKVTGGELNMDPGCMKPIIKAAVHIVRNAIDHGIESPELRGTKPARGTLEFRFGENDSAWLLSIADDGRGIDLQKVGEKAVSLGLVTRAELGKMSAQQIANFILKDGFSTSQVVNDISGRGVGLAAVLKAVEERGGHLSILTKDGEGTRFDLVIPKQKNLPVLPLSKAV